MVDGRRVCQAGLGEYLMGQGMITAPESVAKPRAQPWHATQAIILVLVKESRNRAEKETF